MGYFADLRRHRAWVALTIVTEVRTVILYSFHGIGDVDSGVLGCSAMAFTKEKMPKEEAGETTTERVAAGDAIVGQVVRLGSEPFTFTYLEAGDQVRQRFGKWLEERLIDGLKYWQRDS